MSTVIIEDTNPLRIFLSGGAGARLFGLPFLLIGGYLGYHLILSLYYLLTGQSGWAFVPGLFILIIMTAGFLAPGWLLVFSRARIEIDRIARTVAYVRDLRVYEHRQQRALSEFNRIEVDLLGASAKGRSRLPRGYQVELAGSNLKKIPVGVFDRFEDALAFGRRLGALIGLPVADLSETEAEESSM